MHRLLIVNRGEVASRVARAARSRGISTVGLYSEPDAPMPYLDDVDLAVLLPGESPRDTYLNIEKILGAARRTGCDAIHPGYGFLAESAEFAEQIAAAGIIFIGPPPECIAAMGSKVRAKEIARTASVPVLPDAVVASDGMSDMAEQATHVGFPLLVKASAGGGGRGIRLVESVDGLADAVEAAQREAQSAFADSTVFLERFLPGPRHIEVQIFGDQHGNVVHLGDRECSVQRRHQKLVEECPAPAMALPLREEMCAAALQLAKSIGYVGAGTCEFLVEDDEFYFLEMNTRLQVEHTVTEQVTGIDLVALQLDVAAGAALPFSQADIAFHGHAIQVRVCAENPSAGWAPTTGRVHRYHHPNDDGIRYEDGIATGCTISPHYDSMIVKVIATGGDRERALNAMAEALGNLVLHGPATNLRALRRVVMDDEFRAGRVSVNWLESRPDLAQNPPVDPHAVAAVVATALGHNRNRSPLPAAWSNTRRAPVSWTVIDEGGRDHAVEYVPPNHPGDPFSVFSIDEHSYAARCIAVSPASLDAGARCRVEVDGAARVLDVTIDGEPGGDAGGRAWVNSRDGQIELVVTPRFAGPETDTVLGGPTSPMPGTVISVQVATGQEVAAGDQLLVIEAMKMEHVVRASSPAVVQRVLVEKGQQVDAGCVLVELDPST